MSQFKILTDGFALRKNGVFIVTLDGDGNLETLRTLKTTDFTTNTVTATDGSLTNLYTDEISHTTAGTITLNDDFTGATGTITALTTDGITHSTGGTITVNDDMDMGANSIITTSAPTLTTHMTNKTYVDGVAFGLRDWKDSCDLATAAALPANTYDNVALTLTAVANGALTVDGTAVTSERILIKNEATKSNCGIYDVTQPGTAGTPYILTRAADYDQNAEISGGSYVYIGSGTANGGTQWVMNNNAFTTLDVDSITWTMILNCASYLTNQGDLISHTGAGLQSLALGTDNYVLTADSTQAIGLKWASTATSNDYGEMYMRGNSTATTGIVDSTPMKMAGTTSAGLTSNFTHTNGRLTYNDTTARNFKLSMAGSWAYDGSTSQESARIMFYVYDNSAGTGAVVSKGTVEMEIDDDGDSPISFAVQCLYELDTSDYVEVYVERLPGPDDDIIVQDINLTIVSF